jgi:hypothetical protein
MATAIVKSILRMESTKDLPRIVRALDVVCTLLTGLGNLRRSSVALFWSPNHIVMTKFGHPYSFRPAFFSLLSLTA